MNNRANREFQKKLNWDLRKNIILKRMDAERIKKEKREKFEKLVQNFESQWNSNISYKDNICKMLNSYIPFFNIRLFGIGNHPNHVKKAKELFNQINTNKSITYQEICDLISSAKETVDVINRRNSFFALLTAISNCLDNRENIAKEIILNTIRPRFAPNLVNIIMSY